MYLIEDINQNYFFYVIFLPYDTWEMEQLGNGTACVERGYNESLPITNHPESSLGDCISIFQGKKCSLI